MKKLDKMKKILWFVCAGLLFAPVLVAIVGCAGTGVQGCIKTVIKGVPVEICTSNGEDIPLELLQEVQRLEDK